MKKFVVFSFALALVAIVMTSCFGSKEEPSLSQSDLYSNGGLWLEENTQHYVRFTTEKATDNPGYMYGREWDEDEDVHEEDLKPYGDGWFKYLLEVKNLHELHLMDNHGAEIPKEYVVTKLTDDRLEFYEKDMPSSKFKYNKVVTAK